MYSIKKEFQFSASHVLTGLPDSHPCHRLHGHNYIITVELTDIKLNDVGFVTDYRELEPIKKFIDEKLDHRHLNDVFPEMNPTAENLAKRIYSLFKTEFPQLASVTVSETPKTSAKYIPNFD
jgi:6-pyruvoyltetrahydropterin/6-carboxytetrahydropterin synthase